MLKDDLIDDEIGKIPQRTFCLLSVKIFNQHRDQLRAAQNRENMILFSNNRVFSDGNMQKLYGAKVFSFEKLDDLAFSCNFSYQKLDDPAVSNNILYQKSDDQVF